MRSFAPLACCALLICCAPEAPVDDAGVVDDNDVTLDAGAPVDAGVAEDDAGVPCEPVEPVDVPCTLDGEDCVERTFEMQERIVSSLRFEPRSCRVDQDCTTLTTYVACENGAVLTGCPVPVARASACALQAQLDQLAHEFCTACSDGPCVFPSVCAGSRAFCSEGRCRL